MYIHINIYSTQFRIYIYICKYIYIHLFVCGWECTCVAHMSKSEDSLQELAFFLHHVDSRAQTQVTRLCGKCLYLKNYLTGPYQHFQFTIATNKFQISLQPFFLSSPSLFNSSRLESWIHPCFFIQSITSSLPKVPNESISSWPILSSLSWPISHKLTNGLLHQPPK